MEAIEKGYFYHIYIRGINSCDLFSSDNDYRRFLHLYEKYLDPIADTYAWCLMPNHFHFLLWIKEDVIYKYSNADRSIDAVRFDEMKWETINQSASVRPDCVRIPNPKNHLSHLFNSYTKYYNKRHDRHGSLFERPFKRKQINHENYLKQLVLYIQNNPIHHGFCDHPIEYPWSSYLSCISDKPTKMKREEVIEWFDDLDNFKFCHQQEIEILQIEKYLEI
nr:hypothetical protein [uncultured Marinifilum sp.]